MISSARWPEVERRLAEWAEGWPDRTAIQGLGTKLKHPDREPASILGLSGLIEHDADDQVAAAWAGTPIAELQAALAERGQGLALPETGHFWADGGPGTLGGLCAMGLPHALEGQHGPVRDWVIGMAIVRADRSIARAGSKAVKSVAGYDAHRFFCGSQGRLGAIGAATFRTLPLRAIQAPEAEIFGGAREAWIQRVRPSDFQAARERAQSLAAADPASHTLWHTAQPERVDFDWVLAPDGSLSPSPAPLALFQRAKDHLDPHGRFPGLIP